MNKKKKTNFLWELNASAAVAQSKELSTKKFYKKNITKM